MKARTTGRRCINCGEIIQQNEKLFSNGKEFSHKHSHLSDQWKEVR